MRGSEVMNDIKQQFDGLWPMYTGLVEACDDDAWLNRGTGYLVPARIAIHIPTSLEYYLERDSEMRRQFEDGWTDIDLSILPSRSDVLIHTAAVRAALNEWLDSQDPFSPNISFPWTGNNFLGTAVFMLRHSMYHLGELNSLHYLGSGGEAGDPWMGEI